MLGMRADRDEDGWVVIKDEAGRRPAFQRVPDLREPR
jgi:hypothetical protein